MTILWADSFDHYGLNADDALRSGWNTFDRPVSAALARTGSQAVRIAPSSTLWLRLKRAFDAPRTTIVMAAAYRFDQAPTNGTRTQVHGFMDSNGDQQGVLTLSTAGFLDYRVGDSNAAVVATSSAPVTFATWQHVELRLAVANSSGAVEVRLNGQTVLSYSGDTQATAHADILEWFTSVNAGSAAAFHVDDVVAATDWVGDLRVHTLFPAGDTVQADFVPDSGTTGFSRIREAAPDGDASFVASDSAGAVSLFALDAPPAGIGAIAAVIVDVEARKTDAGACTFRSGLRSGVAVAHGSAHAPDTTYGGHEAVFASDPATGAPWTRSALAAAQLRLERLT
ncbi:hypothetical protein [Zavarzinia sp. CC-PAN008]|uniref:hypothetical protein n=1 Tax=Zavarzinia sp. CC-PAN008 TaxID=3243332 RepID=UPI003F745351